MDNPAAGFLVRSVLVWRSPRKRLYAENGNGVFARNKTENPVRDWNFIYVHYCSGDRHRGANPNGNVPGVGPQKFVGYLNMQTPETSARERRISVLVVNDEPMLRRALEILLRLEYDVTAVTAAESALELIAHGDAFDVVVFDLSRSDMAGQEFDARLQAIGPDVARRAIFRNRSTTHVLSPRLSGP